MKFIAASLLLPMLLSQGQSQNFNIFGGNTKGFGAGSGFGLPTGSSNLNFGNLPSRGSGLNINKGFDGQPDIFSGAFQNNNLNNQVGSGGNFNIFGSTPNIPTGGFAGIGPNLGGSTFNPTVGTPTGSSTPTFGANANNFGVGTNPSIFGNTFGGSNPFGNNFGQTGLNTGNFNPGFGGVGSFTPTTGTNTPTKPLDGLNTILGGLPNLNNVFGGTNTGNIFNNNNLNNNINPFGNFNNFNTNILGPVGLTNPTGGNAQTGNDAGCPLPRSRANGVCVCPNNQQLIRGRCTNVNTNALRGLIQVETRSFNGANNNQRRRNLGSAGVDLERRVPARYTDGRGQPLLQPVSARVISNAVGQVQGDLIPQRHGLTMLFPVFGQLIDHDVTRTRFDQDQNINIPVPRGDPFFDPTSTGTQNIAFQRSSHTFRKGVRTFQNVITSWLDASHTYGSSQADIRALRTFREGKLIVDDMNLPPKDNQGFFRAGDTRLNENISLTLFHIIFIREHNRICDRIKRENPNLSDEQIFQTARKYVIGIFQKITFDDWLVPLLGNNAYNQLIGRYQGYNQNANPNIQTEFSTAAFRLGHPLINAPFRFVTPDQRLVRQLNAGQIFRNPGLVTDQNMSFLAKGLSRIPAKEFSTQIVDDIRSFLVIETQMRIDLLSFNLFRARDHGLGDLNSIRRTFGLRPYSSFNQIFRDPAVARQLQSLLNNDLNQLDLWLAIVGQKPFPDGILGETGAYIVANQFKNIRDGDRFWYEGTYPQAMIDEIKSTTFADLLMRNFDVGFLPENSFFSY